MNDQGGNNAAVGFPPAAVAPAGGHPAPIAQPAPPPVYPVAPAHPGAPVAPQALVDPGQVPLGVLGNGPVPPVHIATYGHYYSLAAHDPFRGNYAEVSSDFRAALAGPSRHSPATLSDRVTAASAAHLPYPMLLCYRRDNDPQDHGTLQIVHRITRVPINVAGPAEPWDGTDVGVVDDLVHDQFNLIPFPSSNFDLTPNAVMGGTKYVPTSAALLQYITANPGAFSHPYLDANAPHADQVRVRQATHIPFAYVPIFLGRKLTPFQGFAQLHHSAQTANQLGDLEPLLDFLRAACMASSQAVPISVVAQAWPHLPQPATPRLLQLFSGLVKADLPGRLGGGNAAAAPNVQPLVDAIGTLADEQRQARLDADNRTKVTAKKSPSQVWGAPGVQKLIRLTQVASEDQLPPL